MNTINSIFGDVNAALDKALGADNAALDKFTEVTGSNGEVTVKRVYDFVNTVGKRSQLTTFDPQVIKITETIAGAIRKREKSSYVICRELFHLKNSGKLKTLGFKNVGEYGKALFDLAPVSANQYARVGEIFLDDDYNVIGDFPVLPVSHYIEFLSFVEKHHGSLDELRDMFINGKLTDGMATKDMRAVLKAAEQTKDAIETEFTDTNASDSANTDSAGNDGNDDNDGNDTNDTNDTNANGEKPFNKADVLNKGLSAIQTLYRVSEELKSNGFEVNFTDSLDKVMESIKGLFD